MGYQTQHYNMLLVDQYKHLPLRNVSRVTDTYHRQVIPFSFAVCMIPRPVQKHKHLSTFLPDAPQIGK
jgi:hypothetical protein